MQTMANCVLSTSIPVRVGGVTVKASAYHSDVAPPANPNLTMAQCRESCGMVGSCEPVGFRRVRQETLENPTGGVAVPENLKNPAKLSEDQCLDQCRKNKDCGAVLHEGGDQCYHLSSVSDTRKLQPGSAQLFLRQP